MSHTPCLSKFVVQIDNINQEGCTAGVTRLKRLKAIYMSVNKHVAIMRLFPVLLFVLLKAAGIATVNLPYVLNLKG